MLFLLDDYFSASLDVKPLPWHRGALALQVVNSLLHTGRVDAPYAADFIVSKAELQASTACHIVEVSLILTYRYTFIGNVEAGLAVIQI